MTHLEKALIYAKSFLQPTTDYMWGTKIYEPKDSDPHALLKQEINAFANAVILHYESKISDKVISFIPDNAEAYLLRIEAELSEPEQSDYFKFIGAIQQVIKTGNAFITSEQQ